jgi:hypothetical protein
MIGRCDLVTGVTWGFRVSAAARQRKFRARLKRGVGCFRIEGVQDDLAKALIRSRRLSEDEALRIRRVERELAAVLAEWAARWLE